MSRASALLLCLLCCLTSPVFAEEESVREVAGIWRLSKLVVNGKAIKDDDLGKRIIVLTEQGTMAAFEDEDAFKSFEPDDVGWYALGKDNAIVLYEDRNENEKLDPQERKNAEVMVWSRDDENLVLTMAFKRGDEEFVFQTILELYED